MSDLSATAPAEPLSAVARMIQRESGIVIKPAQLPSLRDAIDRLGDGLTPERLLDPQVAVRSVDRLIDEITIRETFFFRHRSQLDAIDWHAMLACARADGRGEVNVWVAACASGEEAYSVAILACEAFASQRPPVRILATDIAPAALGKASAGRYGRRAVQALPAEARQRYFVEQDGLVAGERLRGLIEFRRHNLVRDPIPPAGADRFDVVLCRNVLIYFDRPTVQRVIDALETAVSPGGMLVLGAADQLSGQTPPARRRAAAARPRRDAAPRPTVQARAAVAARTLTPPGRGAPVAAPKPEAGAAAPPTVDAALQAADRGELDRAIELADALLAAEPLHCEAHFVRGAAQFARRQERAAVASFRRALYIDPSHSHAAFKLARAHDTLGELDAARRAYERTLWTLDHPDDQQPDRLDRADRRDIATACHARLCALTRA
jgi:chemotaxis methyl-accepting protein methylase